MKIDAANTAVGIVAKIKDLNDKIAAINIAIQNKWIVTSMRANGPFNNDEVSLIIEPLDVDTSVQCFQFALQIYNDQLAALNKQLAAL